MYFFRQLAEAIPFWFTFRWLCWWLRPPLGWAAFSGVLPKLVRWRGVGLVRSPAFCRRVRRLDHVKRDPVSRAMASTLSGTAGRVGVLALTLLCVLLRQKTSAFRGVLLWCHRGCRHWAFGGHHELGRGVLVGTHSGWRAANARTEPAPESVVRLENGAERPVSAALECSRGAFIDR